MLLQYSWLISWNFTSLISISFWLTQIGRLWFSFTKRELRLLEGFADIISLGLPTTRPCAFDNRTKTPTLPSSNSIFCTLFWSTFKFNMLKHDGSFSQSTRESDDHSFNCATTSQICIQVFLLFLQGYSIFWLYLDKYFINTYRKIK